MIHPRSLRFRLTLWYSFVLALGLALLSGFIWIAMRQQLYSEIDAELRSRAQALAEFLRQESSESPRYFTDEIEDFASALPSEFAIEISASNGAVTFATKRSDALFRRFHRMGGGESPVRVEAAGKSYHVIQRLAKVPGQELRLCVADSLTRTDDFLRQLGVLLLTAVPGVVFIAALGGYLLSARALGPVDAMTNKARSIGIENLSERLAIPNTDDEIHRLAEAWNEMLARLETAVTRISQFTSDASHELRTPIALIRSTAEIALRRPRSDEQYRQSLEQIQGESERMTQLVEDLLFLARADAQALFAKMGEVDMRPLIEETCGAIALLAEEKHVRFEVIPSEGPIFLTGREPALRRMLIALLDNALKYTPPGGAISVTAQRANGTVQLSVRDTGIGIADTELPHIFERFFRADPSRNRDSGGHGLGLAIAQTIARHHNGVIVAESSAGQGSEFRVILPATIA